MWLANPNNLTLFTAVDRNSPVVYNYGIMKIVFKRNVDCDYYDHRLDETYPKYFRKWDELQAETIENEGRTVNIALHNEDTVMNVPRGAIEVGAWHFIKIGYTFFNENSGKGICSKRWQAWWS